MKIFRIQGSNPFINLLQFLYPHTYLDHHDDWARVDKPLLNSLKFLRSYGIKTVVAELDYIDADYREEYSFFYSKVFRKPNRNCTRLHFFSSSVSRKDIIQKKLASDNYLGFTVIRPTDNAKIGRTVLRFPPNGMEYCLCQANFDVNLYGNRLTIAGAPFMQQDAQVGACAQACLWMAARYLHTSQNTPWLSPVDISRMATLHLPSGNDLPAGRGGLNPSQMVDAIRQWGMQPLLYSATLNDSQEKEWLYPPGDIIYRYMESRLPIILIVETTGGLHALNVVGHSYIAKPMPHTKTNAAFVKEILVMNDQEGPYRKFSLEPSNNDIKSLWGILVILPPEISIKGEEAEINALNECKHCWPILKKEMNKIEDFFEDEQKQAFKQFNDAYLDNLYTRTYLIASNDFKHYVQSNNQLAIPLQTQYAQLKMPKHIWVTEFSTESLLGNKVEAERKMLGSIIQDSTNSPWSPRSLLAFHIPGALLLYRYKKHTELTLHLVQNDQPYRHLTR